MGCLKLNRIRPAVFPTVTIIRTLTSQLQQRLILPACRWTVEGAQHCNCDDTHARARSRDPRARACGRRARCCALTLSACACVRSARALLELCHTKNNHYIPTIVSAVTTQNVCRRNLLPKDFLTAVLERVPPLEYVTQQQEQHHNMR